jgi:hypothetical protein
MTGWWAAGVGEPAQVDLVAEMEARNGAAERHQRVELQDAAAGEGHVAAIGAARHLERAAADGGAHGRSARHEVVQAPQRLCF